jgi:hypothetical protein
MGVFWCKGCEGIRDSKSCDHYIATKDHDEYCSDECAPVNVRLADIANNLSKIGEHDKLELGVEI